MEFFLWRFSKTMDETAFSSANQLMERMMKKVSRNFPYEKISETKAEKTLSGKKYP